MKLLSLINVAYTNGGVEVAHPISAFYDDATACFHESKVKTQSVQNAHIHKYAKLPGIPVMLYLLLYTS